MDKFDLALLKKCSPRMFEFMKTAAQERRAFELFSKGLLVRQNEVYRVSGGGKSIEYRWSYKVSEAGQEMLKKNEHATQLTGANGQN